MRKSLTCLRKRTEVHHTQENMISQDILRDMRWGDQKMKRNARSEEHDQNSKEKMRKSNDWKEALDNGAGMA
jgi:hypothetical protein